MQHILNSHDRSQAFFKFLLFFLITIILVITAIYFNFKVPQKDNEWLQSQLDIHHSQEASQGKFIAKMEEAEILLDSLDKNDTNIDLINNKLSKAISDLSDLVQNDKTLYGKMNKAIVAKFSEVQLYKKQIQGLQGNTDRLAALQNELQICKGNLDRANARLDGYVRPTE